MGGNISCLGAGSSLCGCIEADAAGVAAGGEESVFESLAGECEGGAVGAVAYVLYWGAGRWYSYWWVWGPG